MVWKYKGRTLSETSGGFGEDGGYELNYLEKSCEMSDLDTFQRMTGFHLISGRWEKKTCTFQLKRYPHSTKLERNDRLKPNEDKKFKG